MKKLILLASLAISLNSFAQIPTNGLVGYWPFNGNATDASGNNNNGTVSGAILTTDRFGNANSAYSFDGVNDLIQINTIDNSVFENDFTISIWCNFSDFMNNYPELIYGENGFIVLNGNGPVYNTESSKISSYQGPLTPALRRIPYFSTNTILQNNIYYHVTLIKNGTTAFLYLNGVLENSIAVNNSLAVPIGNYIQIGSGFNNVSDQCFHGQIDDVRIYNQALSQLEVNALYNEGVCYQYIAVTDTLIINTNITGFNPLTFQNTIKIWPNPANDHITIDIGNTANMTGYQIKIDNSLGQQVFLSSIIQQQFYVDLSTWTGNGIYFVHIIDGFGNTIDIRKIVLQ